jgi:hypothetical protein
MYHFSEYAPEKGGKLGVFPTLNFYKIKLNLKDEGNMQNINNSSFKNSSSVLNIPGRSAKVDLNAVSSCFKNIFWPSIM